ncbi:tRNA dihydrouridine synthase [Legionella clemsonensis]|uniref:tRNA-dihydrouridine synthase n=1 Tax=Legionella clemsonensis TaxID=1867846 RepID=A0A222P681_9GAMM|nr:tRNA-dihydrouridine synthase family protein [Legionella clemsonensis]ASQ47356.1 tRNA-dihydrouridine synthase C [Legionella clemsonensis]
MQRFLNSSLTIGSLQLPTRLIQGPLAGFSCAPFRELFMTFKSPAYCVSEMISAHDVLYKHKSNSRYLFRSPQEGLLCYQIAGNEPSVMADAAVLLQQHGADLIDINCGCPKSKIRKKGAGSALLDNPSLLIAIIAAIRPKLSIPLTVKIRLSENNYDLTLAKKIAEAGADALIVHGRHWSENYAKPCNLAQIKQIKQAVAIPVIANGDINNRQSLLNAVTVSECDGYMVSRAGTGQPWLYKNLLHDLQITVDDEWHKALYMQHLLGLARLENDYKAMLQSKSLFRYYFKNRVTQQQLQAFYRLETLFDIECTLKTLKLTE